MIFAKRILKRAFILGFLLLICSASYTAVFAKQLRCRFVAWSDLKSVDTHFYVDPRMSPDQIDRIRNLVSEAKQRDARIYGVLQASPVVIAGQDDRVIGKYGQEGNRTAVTHLYLGQAYMVLGPDGLDLDVLAHEIMHAELSKRLGWLTKQFKVPAWFDEGLAMQSDYRQAYSEQEWQRKTDGGRLAPPLSKLTRENAFRSSDYWMSFATSKHEVSRWWAIVGKAGFDDFMNQMESGASFQKAYAEVEKKYAIAGGSIGASSGQ